MLFTSYSFIAFLIILLVVYYLIPQRFRWMLLLLGSGVFYAFSGWNNFVYIGVTILTVWITAMQVDALEKKRKAYVKEHKSEITPEEKKVLKKKTKSAQIIWMSACMVINFGILAVFKVLNFTNGILLPLGISFYTFTIIGYLIDVYRGVCEPQKNIARLALYTSFFPQLIQGPINRYNDMQDTLFAGRDFDGRRLAFSAERILWGFFKKLVVADRILPAVKAIIGDSATFGGVYVFIGLVFYATQLYADFTGGIDITIGIANAFGIDMKENFIRPFFSKNLAEYWRRWHISLGKWFTDYVFYPISVSGPVLKLSRFSRKCFGDYIGKRMPVYLSSLAVWFLTGIWHGIGWNFIVWGLANGLIIIISQELEPLYKKFHARFDVAGKKPYIIFQILRTLFITSALRMLDLYRDVPKTFSMLGSMVTAPQFGRLFDGSFAGLGLSAYDYAVIIAGVLIMLAVSLLSRDRDIREKIEEKGFAATGIVIAVLLVAVIVFGAYGIGYDSSQFIYNQF